MMLTRARKRNVSSASVKKTEEHEKETVKKMPSRTIPRSILKELPSPVQETSLSRHRKTRSADPKADMDASDVKKRAFSNVDTFQGRLAWKIKYCDQPVTSTPVRLESAPVTKKDVKDCFGFVESDGEENYSSFISPIQGLRKPRAIKPKSSKVQANIMPQKPNITAKEPCKRLLRTRKAKVESNVALASPKNSPSVQRGLFEKSTESGNSSVCSPSNSKKIGKDMASHTDSIENPLPSNLVKQDFNADVNQKFNVLFERYAEEEQNDVELQIDPNSIKKTYAHKGSSSSGISGPRLPVAKNVAKKRRSSKKKSQSATNLLPKVKKGKKTKQHDQETDDAALAWIQKKNKEFEEVLNCPLLIEK